MPDEQQGGGTPPAGTGAQGGTPEGQQNDGQQQGTTQGQGGTPATWEEALSALPDEVKTLYESHVTGLKSTVTAVRGERDALSGKLTELTKALGKDTPEEARRLLSEMQGELEVTARRAAFYEDAGRPEIGCTNPKAAFALAQADNLFDRRGNPDWAAIKAAAPELFRRPSPGSADGGAGGGRTATTTKDMNEFIRRAAGR